MKSDRYVHGYVFSFLRKGKTAMSLKIANGQGQVKYWLHLADEMKLNGGGEVLAAPVQIPGTDLDPHWIPFWVDMRKSGRVVAGTGATLLVNFTATDGEVITPFFMFSVTAKEEQIIYCDKKGVWCFFRVSVINRIRLMVFSVATCIVISAPELHIAELCALRPKSSPE